MLLAEAQTTIFEALDAVYATTLGQLLARADAQCTRLRHCEEALRLAVIKNAHVHKRQRQGYTNMERECAALTERNTQLQTPLERERAERTEEKEWLADMWPRDVVPLPTLLRMSEVKDAEATDATDQHAIAPQQVEVLVPLATVNVSDTSEQLRMARVNRRVARERVRQQILLANEWAPVVVLPSTTATGERVAGQIYYENARTKQTVWDPPKEMAYEPPPEWDHKTQDWKQSHGLENFYSTAEVFNPCGEGIGGSANVTASLGAMDDKESANATQMRSKGGDNDGGNDFSRTDGNASDEDEHGTDDDGDNDDDDDIDNENGSTANSGVEMSNPERNGDDAEDNEDENEDEDVEPADPVALRDDLVLAFDTEARLRSDLAKAQSQQRAIALQLLNATREHFDREKECLEKEDDSKKAVEREKRVARLQEEEAARATEQAKRARQQNAAGDRRVQPTFMRENVAKKGMTLAKDDELFEKELHELVLAQRADRLYLAAPLARDDRVKFRLLKDNEYVHMKHVEQQVLELEQSEFDLLEKSTLRQEEATQKSEVLKELCARTRVRQVDIEEQEIPRLQARITELEAEAALSVEGMPTEPRPSPEELERAQECGLEIPYPDTCSFDTEENVGKPIEPTDTKSEESLVEESLVEDENEDKVVEDEEVEDEQAEEEEEETVKEEEAGPRAPSEASIVASSDDSSAEKVDTSTVGDTTEGRIGGEVNAAPLEDGDQDNSREQVEVVLPGDEEMVRLKLTVALELQWREWEAQEVSRLEELAACYDQFRALEAEARRSVVDLVLYEADQHFFERLSSREKEVNEIMWKRQADAQIERARFIVERAMCEESVFQVEDEYKAITSRLEDALHLPRRARNPLEKLELIEESRAVAKRLQDEVAKLQERYTKEQAAKSRSMTLELRFIEYTRERLDQERELLTEKQALWDRNFDLCTELDENRAQIESLYVAMQAPQAPRPQVDVNETEVAPEGTLNPEVVDSAVPNDKTTTPENLMAESSPVATYEQAVAVFDEKLKLLAAVRQFLLLCYERETRWRELASIALVKDTTSDEWMTAMQHERHDQMLALLQKQHEATVQELQREIKMQKRVSALVQAQVATKDAQLKRLQSAYQRSSEAVRLETNRIINPLKNALRDAEKRVIDERERASDMRARLMQEQAIIRDELEKNISELELQNEQQMHWLTAAKRELHAQRIANGELLVGYQSLEQRRAAESNDMRFRISAQIRKINNLEMWTLSLKLQAQEAHKERIVMHRKLSDIKARHRAQQRVLRLENWRHRVTAQSVLTDVNKLFTFFAHGVALLAGTTVIANDALRENGGIEVLVALAQRSNQREIRAIAARALGEIAWNTNVTPRALGWKAKRVWFRWVGDESERVLRELADRDVAFDAVASEDSTEMNWLSDTSRLTGGLGEAAAIEEDEEGDDEDDGNGDDEGESASKVEENENENGHELESVNHDENAGDAANIEHQDHGRVDDTSDEKKHKKLQRQRQKKIMFVRSWLERDNIERPNANVCNQEYMGLASGVIKALIDLCALESPLSTGSALSSSSIASIKTLIATRSAIKTDSAGQENDDADQTMRLIQRNALRSLTLVVMNTRNTAVVGRMDKCIPLLVRFLHEPPGKGDVHVMRHAIHALANLGFQNAWNQTQICASGAIAPLLRLAAAHRDVDVLLATVQALSTLSNQNVICCEQIFDGGGLSILTRLCHSFRIHDVIEISVYEQIQAHAAEIVSNVITTLDDAAATEPTVDQQQFGTAAIERNVAGAILDAHAGGNGDSDGDGDGDGDDVAASPAPPGVATFVLLCASCNREVAFHGALVLGSIARHNAIRAAIGDAGGIDALFFLVQRRNDDPLVAQATWALANLTWNRENQYRIARYLDVLHRLCTFRGHTRRVLRGGGDPSRNDEEEREEENGGSEEVVPNTTAPSSSTWETSIREHGLCILANMLFYNDANRVLVASQPTWMSLLENLCRHGRGVPLEHAARALCSLSYSDAVALTMGTAVSSLSVVSAPPLAATLATTSSLSAVAAVNALELFVKLCGHAESELVQRHGLYGIINLCLHDVNKSRLLVVPHGVETLVNLSGHVKKEICDPALEALDLLADVRDLSGTAVKRENNNNDNTDPLASSTGVPTSSLAASDLKRLIALLQSEGVDPALVVMASDAIADQVWQRPSHKIKLRNEHGLEKLLELCVVHGSAGSSAPALNGPLMNAGAHQAVLLSCLWALRNAVADNVRNQDYVGALEAIPQLVRVFDRHRRTPEVVEALLAVLVALVMKHPRNSQELVHVGLDMLLALAEGAEPSAEYGELSEIRMGREVDRGADADEQRRENQSTSKTGNAALARELLYLVAPYNDPALPPLTAASSKKRSGGGGGGGGGVSQGSPDKSRLKKSVHLPVIAASGTAITAASGGGGAAARTPSPTKQASNNAH